MTDCTNAMRRYQWILLAEDNPNDAELVMRTLAAEAPANEIFLVTDGAAALDCLQRRGQYQTRRRGQPAIVLLDVKMPKVDGIQVLQQIKSNEQLSQIPVIMFTSSREEQDIARCYQLGANAYVVKPLEFRQFVSVLQELRAFWMAVNEPPPEGSEAEDLPNPWPKAEKPESHALPPRPGTEAAH